MCNKPYANVKDINMDLVEMIATCQRHTRCSPAYSLKKKKKGVQECRFGYPKTLQPITTINMEGSTPTLLTQRNDCLLNSYNPVQSNQEEGTAIVTLASQLDHYINRITGTEMEELSLLEFVQKFRMPKCIGVTPIRRKKEIVVIVIPYCSPDPQGSKYEQYCRQKLMLHQPFRHLDELLGDSETHSESYTAFLQSSTVPPSLALKLELMVVLILHRNKTKMKRTEVVDKRMTGC